MPGPDSVAAIERSREVEPRRRLRIGVDLDEVLAELVEPILDYHHEQTGDRFYRDDMSSYNFWDTWGGTREEAIERVHGFYATEAFRRLRPVEGSVPAIEAMAAHHDLVVITSRPRTIETHTMEWLAEHFPGAFSEVHLTNDWSTDGHRMTKAEVCDRIGVDVLIEDSVAYARECVRPDRPVVLFSCPWNQGDLPPGVTRFEAWEDISREIDRIATA